MCAEWPEGADVEGLRRFVQRQGEKRQEGVGTFGWAKPLEMYRPLLTYEELGALLSAEPKVLYDAIAALLGLEQLAEAVKALGDVN